MNFLFDLEQHLKVEPHISKRLKITHQMVVERKKEKKKETSNRTFEEKVVFISGKFYRES